MTSSCCLTCKHGAIGDQADAERNRTLRAFAKMGMVNCLLSPARASFRSMRHCCGAFVAGPEEVTAARVEWARSRNDRVEVRAPLARHLERGVMGPVPKRDDR